eukprot:m.262549 g.262549  ORF g.262549 m.262549 type:complete len:282 (-) comp11048_c0_seq6:1504-2349(-)
MREHQRGAQRFFLLAVNLAALAVHTAWGRFERDPDSLEATVSANRGVLIFLAVQLSFCFALAVEDLRSVERLVALMPQVRHLEVAVPDPAEDNDEANAQEAPAAPAAAGPAPAPAAGVPAPAQAQPAGPIFYAYTPAAAQPAAAAAAAAQPAAAAVPPASRFDRLFEDDADDDISESEFRSHFREQARRPTDTPPRRRRLSQDEMRLNEQRSPSFVPSGSAAPAAQPRKRTRDSCRCLSTACGSPGNTCKCVAEGKRCTSSCYCVSRQDDIRWHCANPNRI